jgi:hypothetical protein
MLMIIYDYDYGYITVVLASLACLVQDANISLNQNLIWLKLESKDPLLVAV